MGLDMYAYSVPAGIDPAEDEIRSEIAYWRKFNALHGWMEDLYRSQGGEGSFNCIPVKLSGDDLDRLRDDLGNNRLEPREGFFFGVQEIDPDDVRDTYRFLDAAKEAIADGRDVYYDSWW